MRGLYEWFAHQLGRLDVAIRFRNPFTDDDLHAKLDRLLRREFHTNRRLIEIMATLDDLLANARAMDTRLDSVRALIGDLRKAVADALSGATLPPAAQAKIDEIFDQLQRNDAEVTQALQLPGFVEPPASAPSPVSEPPAPAEPAPPPAATEPAPPTDTPPQT